MAATPGQPIVTGRHACTVGLKSLFKIINEQSPEAGKARHFFEQTKTSLQCERVVSRKETCWLCGNPFNDAIPDLKAQCEHVLPVAQGVIFLKLYNTKTAGLKEAEAVRLEYEYAHAICNRIKSDVVLIKGSPTTGFQPDVDKIMSLISTIRGYRIPIADKRVFDIQGRLFQVTEYINQLPDYTINIDMELCPRKLEFLGGRKTFKRKHNGISRRANKYAHRKAPKSHRKRRTSN